MLGTRHVRFASIAFVASVVSGCSGMEAPEVPLSTRPSLGELVYRVIKEQLQSADDCPTEYVAQLEADHEDFVVTFDHVIEHGIPDDFPELLGGTIKPFIDDDKLPRLVDSLAATLALLIDDEFDPERLTIGAMVDLANTKTLIESSVAIQLAAAILVDDAIPDKLHALAVVAQEDDGVTYVMDDAMDLAAFALGPDETPSTCSGLASPDAQSTLLRTDGFVEYARLGLGSPFYLARPDVNGNPAVADDGGTLRGPFVDADHDRVADVNADGDPIDAAGQPIELAMIGEDGTPGYDEFGRAIDDAGRPIFVYFDTKRTALSYTVQIASDLLDSGIHHELPPVIHAALGEPVACDEGLTCRRYPSAGNVVADLVWFVFEIAEYGRVSVLMHTLTDLLTEDATKSEQLLVAVGDVIRALDGTSLSMTDDQMTAAVRGLVPLLADVLAAPNSSGMPTARLLVQLFQDLGMDLDELPENLRFTLIHQYDPAATGKVGDVDLTQPRFLANGEDNRTGLEQVIELFEYADCGYVGPGSITDPSTYVRGLVWQALLAIDGSISPGTLAEVFVQILSHQSSATVGQLGNLIDGLVSIAGSNSLAWVLQNATGGGGHAACSADDSQKAAALMPALKFLSTSGSLDWILPICKTFGDNGQTRLLVDIFAYIAFDYRRDEDASASTRSSLRALMPALVELTTNPSGAAPFSTPLNRVLDAIDLLVAIPASDGNGNAMDVVIDALAYATAQRTVTTRPTDGGSPGSTTGSIAALLLTKVEALQVRVRTGGAGDELTKLVDGITPLLTTTTGSGAARRLANPNLRMLSATFASVVADATALPASDYLCYVHDLQTESAQVLDSRHLATAVRVLALLATSPNAASLEDWIVSLLRGATDRDVEVYGRLLQLLAGGLSSDASSDDLSQVMGWLGTGLANTDTGGMREMVRTLDELLTSDTQHAMLTMARTAIAPGPLPSGERPITTFLDVASDVGAVAPDDMCRATGRELDAEAVEDTVTSLDEFLRRDPDDGRSSGIERIWSLVGSIAPAE